MICCPLELTFEDFNGIEKIAYMDNELHTEGEPNEFDPDVGDLCQYAPWGNLSIFYKDFRNSNGLISLGHIDSCMDIIGDKPKTIPESSNVSNIQTQYSDMENNNNLQSKITNVVLLFFYF